MFERCVLTFTTNRNHATSRALRVCIAITGVSAASSFVAAAQPAVQRAFAGIAVSAINIDPVTAYDRVNAIGRKRTSEYLLRLLLREGILGAAVYRAVMGFGEKHHIHMPRRFGTSDEAPLLLLFIDEEERVRRVLPLVREAIGRGLIVLATVAPG